MTDQERITDFLYMLYFQQWHQDSSSYRIMPLL